MCHKFQWPVCVSCFGFPSVESSTSEGRDIDVEMIVPEPDSDEYAEMFVFNTRKPKRYRADGTVITDSEEEVQQQITKEERATAKGQVYDAPPPVDLDGTGGESKLSEKERRKRDKEVAKAQAAMKKAAEQAAAKREKEAAKKRLEEQEAKRKAVREAMKGEAEKAKVQELERKKKEKLRHDRRLGKTRAGPPRLRRGRRVMKEATSATDEPKRQGPELDANAGVFTNAAKSLNWRNNILEKRRVAALETREDPSSPAFDQVIDLDSTADEGLKSLMKETGLQTSVVGAGARATGAGSAFNNLANRFENAEDLTRARQVEEAAARKREELEAKLKGTKAKVTNILKSVFLGNLQGAAAPSPRQSQRSAASEDSGYVPPGVVNEPTLEGLTPEEVLRKTML